MPGLTGSNYDPVQLVASNSGDKKSTDALERALARLGKWPPSATNGQEAGAGEPGDVGAGSTATRSNFQIKRKRTGTQRA